MKVLVTGSRTWTDYELILSRLSKLPAGTLVMHGGAGGADRLADKACHELGLTTQVFLADWHLLGKRAGVVRNVEMLDEKPDLVIAFRHGTSPGTSHCINEARRRGIPVELVGEPVQLQLV